MVFKRIKLINLINTFFSHILNYPVPKALTYTWNFGSLAGFCLVVQIISGLFLAMYYIPTAEDAFDSIQFIMRDVKWGWLFRYTHSNGASIFFMVVYLHISKAIYIRSFTRGRVWLTGMMIFVLMMATAFLGYVLPWGQMSLWGATVITSLVTVIPKYGIDLAYWLWGGFSLTSITLTRVYALHYILPFIICGFVFLHLVELHKTGGSRHPLGLNEFETIPFGQYFLYKDHTGFLLLLLIYINFVCFEPNILGEKTNFIKASTEFTPKHIVPEWYFLPFYAMLRSISTKLEGVLIMLGAIGILFLLPITAKFLICTSYFDKVYQFFFWCFISDFLFLGWLGSKVAEEPFVSHSKYATFFYFFYFLFFLPCWSRIEHDVLFSIYIDYTKKQICKPK